MYHYIKMQTKKMALHVSLPLLPGSVSTAQSTCGKPNCACKEEPPTLHGIYYRWTGIIAGKRTTKTISQREATECQKRIRNYRALQKQVGRLLKQSLKKAPWNERPLTHH
jgi:Family of unknown function (DUF6788)